MKRYPNGVEGDFFHQKRVPRAPGLRRRAVRPVPERPLDRLRGRRQRGRARVGRQPRLHRAAHVALARARHRAARLPADRPRPERGQPVGVRARDRARRAGGDGRARPRLVPEDLRRDRAAHPRADPAGAAVPGGAPVREGARRGGRAARRRPGRRDDDLAGGRPERRLRRLRPERARPDDRVGLLGAADAGRARLGAAGLGRGAALDPARFTVETMRERIAEGRRPDRRDVAAQGEPAAALRAARPRAGNPELVERRSSRSRRWTSSAGEELLDGRVAALALRAHLVPGALLRDPCRAGSG